jgi:hypothetical protein
MAMLPPREEDERVSRRLRTARVRRTPTSLGAMITALAIVGLLFYAFVLRPAPSVTAPALTSASGRFVVSEEQRGEVEARRTSSTGSFVLSGDGNGAVEVVVENAGLSFDRPGPGRYVYDAARREALHVTETRAGGERAVLVEGAWPPLWRVGPYTPLEFEHDAAVVRAAVEDDDETIGIKTVLYEGREAWRASWRNGAWQKDLIVDQETGLVLWYSLTDNDPAAGAELEYRVEGLALDEPVAVGSFDTTPPAGARLVESTIGDPEIVGGVDEAAERVGVALPRSTLDPDGYRLVAVGVTATRGAPAVWVEPRAAWPAALDAAPNAAVLVYAKGLSSYTIEIVAGGPWTMSGDRPWTSLFGYRPAELQYSHFAGRTAHTWYGQGPTAVVWDDDYAVCVSGGLTRTEAIGVLEGLEL